jgi:fructokinase
MMVAIEWRRDGGYQVTNQSKVYGAVEAGGTKFVCAIGDESGKILKEERFPTQDPASTLANMRLFLRRGGEDFGALSGVGVGSFGPVQLDRRAADYGYITRTPKPGWSGTDIIGGLKRDFSCAVGFDTDVNAAALAEHRWGAAQDVQNFVYVTVGTGIGGGALVNGKPIHGVMHPEIGHFYPRRHPRDAGFPGICPFHRDCMEGVASGPAIQARSGASLQDLDPSHVQWELEADDLGQLCAQLVLALSPQRILMGGGVMNQLRLLGPIRRRMRHWLGGYIDRSDVLSDDSGYIVTPGLGERAGVLGALALAIDSTAA